MEPNRHWSFVFGGEAAVRPRVPTLHVFWTVLRCSEERENWMVCGHSPEIETLRCDKSVDEEKSIIYMSSVFPAKTLDAKNRTESSTDTLSYVGLVDKFGQSLQPNLVKAI